MPNIRQKGQNAERAVCNLLEASKLCKKAVRNLDQTRSGGGDIEALEHFSIEVKRHEKQSITAWWRQSSFSANAMGKVPMVIWRPSRKEWLVMIPAGTIKEIPDVGVSPSEDHTAPLKDYKRYSHIQFISFPTFANWYRWVLSTDPLSFDPNKQY